MLLVGHHSSPLTSARPPAGLEGTQHAPLCTLQCPQIRPSSPSRPRFSIPSRVRNYFIMIKAAKLSFKLPNCVRSVRSAFGPVSAFGQRGETGTKSMRVARRRRHGAREQSVQSCALTSRRGCSRRPSRDPPLRGSSANLAGGSGVVSSRKWCCFFPYAFLCILVHPYAFLCILLYL